MEKIDFEEVLEAYDTVDEEDKRELFINVVAIADHYQRGALNSKLDGFVKKLKSDKAKVKAIQKKIKIMRKELGAIRKS